MEGLEAFCGMAGIGEVDTGEDEAQYMRVDERTGRAYASAMPMRAR